MENDLELIYTIPRERLYGFMHLLSVCASVGMCVFVVLHSHRDMIDLGTLWSNPNEEIPIWVLYSVAMLVSLMFVGGERSARMRPSYTFAHLVLSLMSHIPVRLYYSPTRRCYALFYHPIIGVFRQKKISFQHSQYRFIPNDVADVKSSQRSLQIRIELGQSLLAIKKNFYFMESYFRSRRDIYTLQSDDAAKREAIHRDESHEPERTSQESDIWETVVENKQEGRVPPKGSGNISPRTRL